MARSRRQPRARIRTERQLLAEASNPALDMLGGGYADADEGLYRPLTQRSGDNLPEYTQEKMLFVARYLSRVNPVGTRILTLLSDFVLGEGVDPAVSSTPVRAVVMRHWTDRTNNWNVEMPRRFRRYLKTGEYLMPLFVNPVDGHMRIGSMPSERIKAVHTDPDNWEHVVEVEMKPRLGESAGARYTVVNGMGAEELGNLPKDAKPALWWTHGNDDGQRGISILYAIADYLDAQDQFMFSEVERWLLMKAFVWDVTVKGADQAQIDEMVRSPAYQTPAPGQVIVHNDQQEWQAKSPRLDTNDAANGIRLVRNHALGAIGIPEHWYAEGGDVNRATAAEMAESPRKRLTALQNDWRYVVMDTLWTQTQYAILAGVLPAELQAEDEKGRLQDDPKPAGDLIELNMPDVAPDDQQVMANVLVTLATALTQAEDSQYVSPQTAQRAFLLVLKQMGVDFDADAEIERIQLAAQSRDDEKQRDAERLYQRLPTIPRIVPAPSVADAQTGAD